MIALQVINKILDSDNLDFFEKNGLTIEHFSGYENEITFIVEHFRQYNKIPDKETFCAAFPEFDLIDVKENNSYLLDTIVEEYLYYKAVPVIQKTAEILKTNAKMAVEYLSVQVQDLGLKTKLDGTNIIELASNRYEVYQNKKTSEKSAYITTGFAEIDDILHGWAKGEEFAVIIARTGQGKSWILTKTLSHAWQIGYRVGCISPEMGPDKLGYRFDTLVNNFSNTALVCGREESGYGEYISELKNNKNPFIIAVPKDFEKKVTISKLRTFIQMNKLDILGIDGITYLTDERYKRGDNKTTGLTNISEDLMSLSLELGVPIIVAAQSNRSGVKKDEEEGTPDLDTIRDSDGIAFNATKVIAIRQTGAGLEFGIKKHRDGPVGDKLIYYWDIDKGIFTYIPSSLDGASSEHRDRKIDDLKKSFGNGVDVF
jgi:replicative DNA helicase